MTASPLLEWSYEPSATRGIHFACPGDQWDFWSYEQLANLAIRVATGLTAVGVKRGDVVGLILPSSPEFVAALFGTMLAGAIVSPLPPAMVFQDPQEYACYVARLLAIARPRVVITDRKPHISLTGVTQSSATFDLDTLSGKAGDFPVPLTRPSDLALLQFTSGSSGRNKAVCVPFCALEANVAAIRSWLEWTADDPFVSWLPLHHDMGLVGALICSTVSRSDLWLLQPGHFIRDPVRYLRCFGERGARLTVTASFGVNYIVRHVRPEALQGMNFAEWRGVVIGAERIDGRALDDLYKLLAPRGFQRSGFLPAYGMAESTLAVTGVPLREGWTEISVSPDSLLPGNPVRPSEDGSIAHTVVGCGVPLRGLQISIAGETGEALPEGHIGEILVQGTSVATGYSAGGVAASHAQFANGTLRTGDAGFLLDSQLFVLGRLGDSLKVRGRIVFGEDLEAAACRLGLPRERVAAVLGVHAGLPTAVIVIEKVAQWPFALAGTFRRLAEGATIMLAEVPRGTIPRTTSGKVKRRELWRSFARGELLTEIVSLSA